VTYFASPGVPFNGPGCGWIWGAKKRKGGRRERKFVVERVIWVEGSEFERRGEIGRTAVRGNFSTSQPSFS